MFFWYRFQIIIIIIIIIITLIIVEAHFSTKIYTAHLMKQYCILMLLYVLICKIDYLFF